MDYNHTLPTHVAAFRVAARLAEARAELAHTTSEKIQADYSLASLRALHEQQAIDQAGGDKALGTNAEARARALTLALAADADYQAEVAYGQECELAVRMSDVELHAHRDQLSILLACLDAGITEIDEDLLWLGLPAVEATPVQPDELWTVTPIAVA